MEHHNKPIGEEPIQKTVDTTKSITDENLKKTKQDHKTTSKSAMAKRGLKSLTVMVAVPTLLTLIVTLLSSTSHSRYVKLAQHSKLLPPALALNWVSVLASFIMGSSAWLVWVDGGFHRQPRAFQVYLAWLVFNVAWNPVVIGYGASWVGLGLGLGLVGAVAGCWKMFKVVNPIAGTLVLPCLALSGLLALVNLKLVFA